MSYKVESSEKLCHSASETETKAMLYLMNFREDSDEIYYFVVDFFNDLTGMDRMSQKLWDLQSKGTSNTSSKTIGKELVTLFKNYVSPLAFDHYILFVGGVSSTVRIDPSKNVFGIENINSVQKKNIIAGLQEEAFRKTYIDNSSITEKNMNDFLQKVIFVVDDKKPCEYVKAIIKTHPHLIPNDTILTGIFNEIRNQQASKKNNLPVEGITIQTTDEALSYCRHLTNSEIRLVVLGRIINRNPFEKGIPISFLPIYNHFPPETQAKNIEECQCALSRALFDVNNADNFWKLFETIYRLIIGNPQYCVNEIFQQLDSEIKRNNICFDVLSLKYFIATIKDGVRA